MNPQAVLEGERGQTKNQINEAVQQAREAHARTLRPNYFEHIDSLLASGAFAVEERRQRFPRTGRRYAD